MLSCRPQLEEKYVLEANGGQLQQQLQVFAAALPWVYELQVAALTDSSAHHMTLLDHVALQVAQQEQQGRQATPLLEHMLAQRGKWEHLQLIPLGIEMYQWANDNLTGLATEEAVRSTSLHQYVQRAQHRDTARAQRLAQVYQRFKHSWNAFHKAQDGYRRDECREDAKFELITDSTPLSFFISWQDPAADDYILCVLKNVVDIQNRFMAVAQEAMPSATIHAAPASLLRDPTLALGLLDSHSLKLEHTVASYIQSSTSPTPAFDLAGLTVRVVSWLQSKQTITDDLSQIRQVFKPWQPETVAPETSDIGGVEGIRPLDLGTALSLSLAYKQPMPPQQHSTLSSHMGSMSFEQLQATVHALQQVAAAVVHHTPLAVSAPSQPAQRRSLQPTDSLSAAIAAANPDSKLKSADCVNGLSVAHTHAVLLMAAEKLAGQSHLYAHLPQFVKVPLPDAQGKQLKNSFQQSLLADPHKAEVLSELLTDLRRYAHL